MQYKSLLLDVDGTIVPVGPHTTPSPGVISAIQTAKNHVHVSIVSGRPLPWLIALFETLDLTSPCIINGGSQIVDPKTQTVLWERPLALEDVRTIANLAKAHNISFLVNDNGNEHRDPASLEFNNPLAVQLSFLDREHVEICMNELRTIGSLAAHEFPSWQHGKHDIYITHAEATKAQAVQKLASLLGLTPDEMIGIGDAKNDIPLLSVCGLKIAMGNGHDDLKRVAHHVAPSVADDGVAKMIERFILPNGFLQ